MRRRTTGSSAPISNRSGCKKSCTALPSRKNSGFEATCTLPRPIILRKRAAVPTGTVERVTMIAPGRTIGAIFSATASTSEVLAEPSGDCGVGTQIKMMEARAAASVADAQNVKRFKRMPSRTISARFGSHKSTCPAFSRRSFLSLASAHTTE